MKNSETNIQNLIVGLLEAELEHLEAFIELGFSIEDWLTVRREKLNAEKRAYANLIEPEQESAEGNFLNEDNGHGLSFSKLPF